MIETTAVNTFTGINPVFYALNLGEKTKAFDTSRHNHPITNQYPNGVPFDFNAAYADGYRIWIGRASVGNYYIDPWFSADYEAARAARFICLAYHVSAPECDNEEQVLNLMDALGGWTPDGIVLDAELSRNQTPRRVTDCNQYLAGRFEQMSPNRVLLYTNLNFGNNYLLSNLGLPLMVANPGPGGGMNFNPSPAMPKWWNEYVAWQKDWKHTIPGVADPSVDYSEFQMSEQEAREYFWVDDGEEDNEMTILTKLDEILINQGVIISNQGIILNYLHDGVTPPAPPVEPPVVPPPAVNYFVRVTIPRANARFAKSQNANELPIMQIYPSDNSLVSERIQFTEDTLLRVIPNKERADGGGYYYMLLDWEGRGDEDLYLRDADCVKTW
jgi:GH25 family lysozyme M1 (1,4-beta-N-acetylmuramidase)